jgi:hypothetical protein
MRPSGLAAHGVRSLPGGPGRRYPPWSPRRGPWSVARPHCEALPQNTHFILGGSKGVLRHNPQATAVAGPALVILHRLAEVILSRSSRPRRARSDSAVGESAPCLAARPSRRSATNPLANASGNSWWWDHRRARWQGEDSVPARPWRSHAPSAIALAPARARRLTPRLALTISLVHHWPKNFGRCHHFTPPPVQCPRLRSADLLVAPCKMI